MPRSLHEMPYRSEFRGDSHCAYLIAVSYLKFSNKIGHFSAHFFVSNELQLPVRPSSGRPACRRRAVPSRDLPGETPRGTTRRRTATRRRTSAAGDARAHRGGTCLAGDVEDRPFRGSVGAHQAGSRSRPLKKVPAVSREGNSEASMGYRNEFAVSYGLIVVTNRNSVMLIRRKVPYCVQNFYVFLDDLGVRHDPHDQNPFGEIKNAFESSWLPSLDERDRTDYARFLNGERFEDAHDYPHGQYSASERSKSRYLCFVSAYREFREETGFRFAFTREDVDRYPLFRISFEGCDGNEYTQYYFLVRDVRNLRRFRYFDSLQVSCVRIRNWKDDRLLYTSRLTPVDVAFDILKEQQSVKTDGKHLLLRERKSCSEHEFCHWRCSDCRKINNKEKWTT